MSGEMAILEACDVVREGEAARAGRWAVRLVRGQPGRLVTPKGDEGPLAWLSPPLSEAARRQLPRQAAQILFHRPEILGFAIGDPRGEIEGVVPADRLRRLIVRALDGEADEARQVVAKELGLGEEAAGEVVLEFGGLKGLVGYVPGPPGPPMPPVTVYVCPVEGCGFMYVPHQAGAPIPNCPEHQCRLVPKTLGQGG